MTYLISVSSAVINKRALAMDIRSMGITPDQIVQCLLKLNPSYGFSKNNTLQNMVERHSINHQAYPVLHYFSTADLSHALSVHIAALDEALTHLLFTKEREKYEQNLFPLRKSITDLLYHIEEKYQYSDSGHNLKYERGKSTLFNDNTEKIDNDEDVIHRRQVLGRLLKNENLNWQQVYDY